MNHDTSALLTSEQSKGQMTRLIDSFVEQTPGVDRVVLASRDGLKQVTSSKMDENWADEIAAAFSGIVSLARGVTGPTSKLMNANQILIEREDTLFLAISAGIGQDQDGKSVDTILVVLANPSANIGAVGYAMVRLAQKFGPFMTTPVRERALPEDGAA
ncbi:roadblock/LC7 domain-containing protein [Streptomyces acidiscabies]|uniref:roadblock/LC7 domain-containing protein n=1 Tax=Streptomyces acidiscabies TaxID=42234 RepID=UPI00096A107F|nr:roadblock/LC7 domain-containing protein [Streptomyces acidiscabies]GAV38300.1 Roadblock/LC7 domain protein [Streptomyces acidiscabies]